MALTTWNDVYSIKVEKLDIQHKNVFEMINSLADAMRKGQGASAIKPTLEKLTKHLCIHAVDEEEQMRRTGYPELSAHQNEHHSYQLRAERLKADLEKTGNGDTVSLLLLLRDIILKHILQTDAEYSAHINASGI